ncbi:regulatory protein RecX [Pedobacter sp.]|uniref:regulatory protein RecX n=1 Tax=Pedobacter sp. TaxID=1411316 RepID=UPI00396C9E9D
MKSVKENKIALDQKSALLKAEQWCAYQERSQHEMRNKLYEWELKTTEIEEIIAELIANNFLNEERFALSYASGKHHIKKWGKLKIKQGLKLKRVPDKIIQKALSSLNEETYLKNLTQLFEKKAGSITEKNAVKRSYKLLNYLLSKGYEKDLIFLLLKNNELD